MFLVPTDSPGFEVVAAHTDPRRRIHRRLHAEIDLTGCTVGDDAILGEPG